MITDIRVGNWIQVYSGKCFYPLDPRSDEVDIIDIAHSLSLKCRYGGHCKEFYSVAEHSVIVSHFVPPEFALWGLLHDAGEVYSADLPRPLKRSMPDWVPMEALIMKAVCEKFGLDIQEPPMVKSVDFALTADEKAVLMADSIIPWGELPPPIGANIRCLSPKEAEKEFLTRFYELYSE